MCEFQALLLIGFQKGETDTVISDATVQSVGTLTFKITEHFRDDQITPST
jgi:hypothetical protein